MYVTSTGWPPSVFAKATRLAEQKSHGLMMQLAERDADAQLATLLQTLVLV